MGFGIVRAHLRPSGEQPFNNRDGGCLPHVVGSRFERESPDGEGLALQVLAEVPVQTLQEPLLLRDVDLFDGLKNSKLVSLLGGRFDERLDVLGKAAAAVADAGEQK